jgi:hypothetical protein
MAPGEVLNFSAILHAYRLQPCVVGACTHAVTVPKMHTLYSALLLVEEPSLRASREVSKSTLRHHVLVHFHGAKQVDLRKKSSAHLPHHSKAPETSLIVQIN